jgi:dipeptidyl aminopeptidase/acylaminoacyl peptidase
MKMSSCRSTGWERLLEGRTRRLMKCFSIAIVAVLTTLSCSQSAFAQGKLVDLSLLRSYVEIEFPKFSPDGKTIAYVAVHQDFKKDVNRDQVMLLDIATKRARPLGAPFQGLSALAWSPRGDRIAMIADASETAQILTLSPVTGKSSQVTHAPRDVLAFAWRPDGGAIAYTMHDLPKNGADIAKNLDAFEVGDVNYLSNAAPTPAHLWLIAASGGPARRLTSGSWSVASSELIFPMPEVETLPYFGWSPDGHTIIFSQLRNAYIMDAVGSTTMLLDVASGRIQPLTEHSRLEMGGVFSQDGKRVAYAYARDDKPLGAVGIFITTPAGGNGIDVTAALDKDVLGALWTHDGRLLIHAFDGTHCPLWLVTTSGSAQRLNMGAVDAVAAEVAVSRTNQIAFVGSEPQRPTELYYFASPGLRPIRITNENEALALARNGRVETITWQNDGFQESGALFYPPDFTPGKKYPLVLQIHGGPIESSLASWRDTDWPGLPNYLAAHGWLVFSPNYRGSDGYGNAYQLAIFNDAGAGPGRDVMAGIEAINRLGIVDENRMAVSGWSYGGFMTTWLESHYDVWRAAVAGAPPTDAFVDYATSNYGTLGQYFFEGPPWKSPTILQAYRDQSPLTYAGNVKAPTLLLSDTGDTQVPIIHSYEYYHALKDSGVTVSFVAYPVSGHFPADPVRQEDIYRRWAAWLDHYLK